MKPKISTQETESIQDTVENIDTILEVSTSKSGHMVFSILGALIGMLLGTIPSAAAMYITGRVVWLLFALMPVFICTGALLLGGSRDFRTMILAVALSLVGYVLIFLTCQSVTYLQHNGMAVWNLPLITLTSLRDISELPLAFQSEYVFPLVFLIMGMFIGGEILFTPLTPRTKV